ncbi:Calx-beta domain-containing protein [Lyngbya sp. CCY1209]|uniref:Calx-beta domain-containing protein n=1 Tax=Lyngbya sp. CCY1209 TaxID=2886103 RepID=UPI002D20576A|nr:Calx-beta domain-containing protein [Lyngbya sp. CCY1209]MEB3884137.1 hypothetical protein [Lyngbya sp. CCY1209]
MDSILNSETAFFVPETDILGLNQIEKENLGLGCDRAFISSSPLAGAIAWGLPEETTPNDHGEAAQAELLLNSRNEAIASGDYLLLTDSAVIDSGSGRDLLTGYTEEMSPEDSEDVLTDDTRAIEKMVYGVLPTVQELLQDFADTPEFEVEMRLAFGNRYDAQKADVLMSALSGGDVEVLQGIEIVDCDFIKGANGAFAGETETIYLAREFVSENSGNVGAIASVIVEEFGHYLDWEINSSDTPGDEGEIFASFVLGEELSLPEFWGMKVEDDGEIVFLYNDKILIEKSSILNVTKTGKNDIDSLIGSTKWNMNDLNNKITYGFVVADGDGYDSEPLQKYGNKHLYPLNHSGQSMVRKVLNDLEKIIPIDFVETSYSYNNPPIMVFMGVETDGNLSFAYYPSNSYAGGDVFLDNDYQDSYDTVAHEIGHALGLKHPGFYNKDDNGPFLPASKDNTNWTVMSYNNKFPLPQDYQSLDIKALQYLYGKSGSGNRQPSIQINDISIKEGDRTKRAMFKVTLDTRATETVKVGYQTVSDTASSGDDYRYKSGTITFKPGQKTKKIRVPIYGDNFNEGNRGFWVNLTNPSNAEISDGWGYGSIIEDDLTVTPSVKINDISITEGDRTKRATFKVTLDTRPTQSVKVDYQTVNDTAWSAFDYRHKSGTITFKLGQKTKKIRVPIYGNNYYQGDRNFWVYLSNPRNAEIESEDDQWGHAWILEDDF